MAYLNLIDVQIDFPVFTSRSRGILNTLLRKTDGSGRMDNDSAGRIRIHALRNINIHLREGDRIGLIGSNGAGKSTLLKVLSGVYEPTSGIIESKGNISSLIDLMLGMDPDASGYEFIITRSIVMGLSRTAARNMIGDVEEFTGLREYLHLPVRTYSSGMLLRLAFAVATASVPDILLMDEMIGVGDANFLSKAQERLEKMMQRVKILVLASHSESILKSFCDKGLVMVEGRLEFFGAITQSLEFYHENNSKI